MSGPRLAKGRYGRRYVWPPTGDEVPSVTTILNQKSKPALKNWAAKEVATYAVENILEWQNLPPDDAIDLLKRAPYRNTRKAADIGTAVHTALEAWVNGEKQPTELVDIDLLPYVAGGVQWLDDHVSEVLFTEATVFNLTYRYAGTVDLIVNLKDGRTAIADWKSGKGLYEEVAWQLTAYAKGEFIATQDGDEWTPTDMPDIDVGIGVHIPGDAGYTAKEVQITDRRWKEFVALRTIQRFEDEFKGEVFSAVNSGEAASERSN